MHHNLGEIEVIEAPISRPLKDVFSSFKGWSAFQPSGSVVAVFEYSANYKKIFPAFGKYARLDREAVGAYFNVRLSPKDHSLLSLARETYSNPDEPS